MAGTEPQRNDRRGTASGSPPIVRHWEYARDGRAFLWNGTGAVVMGFGRIAAGEVKQKSALVTVEPIYFPIMPGFIHERMFKGAGITIPLTGKTCFYGGVIGLSGRDPNLCGWSG